MLSEKTHLSSEAVDRQSLLNIQTGLGQAPSQTEKPLKKMSTSHPKLKSHPHLPTAYANLRNQSPGKLRQSALLLLRAFQVQTEMFGPLPTTYKEFG
jgi:hypothetical protein